MGPETEGLSPGKGTEETKASEETRDGERVGVKGVSVGREATVAFYALESEIYESVKLKLHCKACCAVGTLVKNGGAGTVPVMGCSACSSSALRARMAHVHARSSCTSPSARNGRSIRSSGDLAEGLHSSAGT